MKNIQNAKKLITLSTFMKKRSPASQVELNHLASSDCLNCSWIPSGGLVLGPKWTANITDSIKVPSIVRLDWGYRLAEFLDQNLSLIGDRVTGFISVHPNFDHISEQSGFRSIDRYKEIILSNYQQCYPTDKWNLLFQRAFKANSETSEEESVPSSTPSIINPSPPSRKKSTRKKATSKGEINEKTVSSIEHKNKLNKFALSSSFQPLFTYAELSSLFTPEKFGFSFISHAHADHCPGGYGGWTNDQDFGPLYPFPVLATASTLKLTQIRFKSMLPNASLPQASEPEMHKIQEKLVSSFARYMVWAKGHPLLHGMLSEYFNPFPIQSGWGWFIPNGHIFGSAGLCMASPSWLEKAPPISELSNISSEISASTIDLRIAAEIIYLNEFNPLPRPHTLPCPPVECRELLIDALFADPQLNFPDPEIEFERLLSWIQSELRSHPVILFCRELGKPQWIIGAIGQRPTFFRDLPDACIVVDAAEKRILDYCQSKGLALPPILTKTEARTRKYPQSKNYLLITELKERESPAIQKLISERGAVTAEMTGWCIDPSYQIEHPADAYFCISDHIPFTHFRSYLEKCEFSLLTLIEPPSPLIAHKLSSLGWNVRVIPGISEKIYDPDFFY